MHANELLKRIVTRLAHQTESERDLLLAAVDIAFPLDKPKPELSGGGLDMETKAKLGLLPGADEDQAPPVIGPGMTDVVFSDSKAPAGA